MKQKGKDFLKIPVNRIIALVFLDVISIFVASFAAIYIRFDFSFSAIPEMFMDRFEFNLPFILLITLLFFVIWKLYKSVWRYASATELYNIIAAVTCSTLGILIFSYVVGQPMPRSYYILYWFLIFGTTCAIRFSYRILRIINMKRTSMRNADLSNVMVIGAGAAADAILKEIMNSSYLTMKVVCIVDDNPGCKGKLLRGVPIIGGRDMIADAVSDYEIDEIIFAIPSASNKVKKELLDICKETGCKMRTLPGIYQLINGEVSVAKLKEVEIEDLLGRNPIEIDTQEVLHSVRGKTILVTGGGGSIGSELCRQIAANNPKRLILVDIYENSTYDVQQELMLQYPALDLVVLIGSVRNTNRINAIMKEYRPEIVYHAAAHKHVPLMETSPNEAIKNNVFGTYKTAMAAIEYGVQKFVLISTDKAVNPTNIMGASKRMCEMMIQMLNGRSKTNFVAVRFGNVLGSNGSVIPLFKKQIEAGGPVTVTHPDIIRYFMTIPEAVSLVLEAGAYAKGGEIFVLDMGEPVKILDLAENLIKLSGYKVGEDIEIVFTGLRPGEKMYEELLMKEEGMKTTANKMIFVGKPIEFNEAEFEAHLNALQETILAGEADIRPMVKEIVPTYQYDA